MVRVSLQILGMNGSEQFGTVVAAPSEPLNLRGFFDNKSIFSSSAALLLQIVTLGGRQRPKSVNSWPT